MTLNRVVLVGFLLLNFVTPRESGAKSNADYSYYQKLTGDDSDSDKSRWDAVYRKNKGYVFGREPAAFLVESLPMLPVGRALDIAMGEGRNSVYLAKKGFDVTGVDISEVAVRKARKLAIENKVKMRTIISDLNAYKIPAESYDVILVFYYLQRSLVSEIVRGLKPNGVVVFENFTVDQLKHDRTQNRSFLLERGELQKLFKDTGLKIEKYREADDGKTAIASLVARKVR